jgi:hypothetical protein
MTIDAPGAAASPPRHGGRYEATPSLGPIAAVLVVVLIWIAVATLLPLQGDLLDATRQAGQLLLTGAALALGYLSFRVQPGPLRFEIREGVGFVVPANPAWGQAVVAQVLLFGATAGSVVSAWVRPAEVGPGTGTQHLPAIFPSVLALLLGCAVAVSVAGARRGRPRLELTPPAVVVYGLLGARTLPWDALRPEPPALGARWRAVRLTVDRPELVVGTGVSGKRAMATLTFARIHPWLLADAIRYYVEHPEQRAAIGTRAGHERLLTDLGVPQ